MKRLRLKSETNASRISEALASDGFIVLTRFDGTFYRLTAIKF